jgi:hypothetical protein
MGLLIGPVPADVFPDVATALATMLVGGVRIFAIEKH